MMFKQNFDSVEDAERVADRATVISLGLLALAVLAGLVSLFVGPFAWATAALLLLFFFTAYRGTRARTWIQGRQFGWYEAVDAAEAKKTETSE